MTADRKATASALADRLAEDLAMLRATKGVPPALLAHKISELELMIEALRAFANAECGGGQPEQEGR